MSSVSELQVKLDEQLMEPNESKTVLHDRTESKDRTQRGLRSHAFLLKQALDQSYLRGGPLKGYPDTNQRPLKRQKARALRVFPVLDAGARWPERGSSARLGK